GLNTNKILRFDSATPSQTTEESITGLPAKVSIRAISSRPATGQLYGLGNDSHLYTLTPTTDSKGWAANVVGNSSFGISVWGLSVGFQFNPVTDQIRVITDGQNFRLNPDTGAILDGDPNTPGIQLDHELAFATSDAHVGQTPDLGGIAYTNSFA